MLIWKRVEYAWERSANNTANRLGNLFNRFMNLYQKTLAHVANILMLKLNQTFVKFCINFILWVFRPNIAKKISYTVWRNVCSTALLAGWVHKYKSQCLSVYRSVPSPDLQEFFFHWRPLEFVRSTTELAWTHYIWSMDTKKELTWRHNGISIDAQWNLHHVFLTDPPSR